MIQVILHEPQIPPNTGNIIRLCANTGADLHLIQPLGFALDDKKMRRAGLDHARRASIHLHENFAACRTALPGRRWLAIETGDGPRYDQCTFNTNDVLLFGSETRGLPDEVLAEFKPEHRLRIPQLEGSRSLNLSNAVAVVAFEAWRQLGFPDAE
ncbi:MAG: tRNA (cytidine(34)-2'-O)-methyltransferase [Symploca sp. SIO2G7]|nr:tRNA (cytidine(34)-2'-O)-methyltransferase [Symploca sp. SIO2G7]